MNLRRGRQISFFDSLIKIDSHFSKTQCQIFEIIIEIQHLSIEHCAEDSANFTFLLKRNYSSRKTVSSFTRANSYEWKGHVNQIESTLKSLRDLLSTTTRWTHGGKEMHVLSDRIEWIDSVTWWQLACLPWRISRLDFFDHTRIRNQSKCA